MSSRLMAGLERGDVELERDVDLQGEGGVGGEARSGLTGRGVSLKQTTRKGRNVPAGQSRQSRTSGESSPCPLVQGRSLVEAVGVGPNERSQPSS